MYLVTILAYALLFWRAEGPAQADLHIVTGPLTTSALAACQPLLLFAASLWSARRARRSLTLAPDMSSSAQQFHHRAMLVLRVLLIAGFAVLVLGTPWPTWFAFGRVTPELQIVGDVLVLSPFVLGMVGIWGGAYPIEKRIREAASWFDLGPQAPPATFWHYLDFHLRHQLLIVAVPLTLILFAANLTSGYASELRRLFHSDFAPDLLLGAAAALVFVAAPLMLRRIWRTEPLPVGPLRDRLQTLCRQIDLRVKDILIWKSDGMMINAAVMGITGRLRYVLLSDALLATMSPKQVEAVFAHEAGHVRHHHIPHFLMFALAAWVVVAALMEGLALVAVRAPGAGLSLGTIQTAGIIGTLVVWGVGFGWVSRRFERQADLFGARCAAPADDDCDYPCSVHWQPNVRHGAEPPTEATHSRGNVMRNAPTAGELRTQMTPGVAAATCEPAYATAGNNRDSGAPLDQNGRVCATGAAIFASALERVALLNGIPREERSWRHSSIASRIRFLFSLAADPSRTAQFERVVQRIQIAMLIIGLGGSAVSLIYWRAVGTPALIRLQTGDLPEPMVSPIAGSRSGVPASARVSRRAGIRLGPD